MRRRAWIHLAFGLYPLPSACTRFTRLADLGSNGAGGANNGASSSGMAGAADSGDAAVDVNGDGTDAADTNGLVGFWSFDEGAGTIAHDSSGRGNDGTLVG